MNAGWTGRWTEPTALSSVLTWSVNINTNTNTRLSGAQYCFEKSVIIHFKENELTGVPGGPASPALPGSPGPPLRPTSPFIPGPPGLPGGPRVPGSPSRPYINQLDKFDNQKKDPNGSNIRITTKAILGISSHRRSTSTVAFKWQGLTSC